MTSEICGGEGVREGGGGGRQREKAFPKQLFHRNQPTLTVPFDPGEAAAAWGPVTSRCGVRRAGKWGLLPPFLPCPFGRRPLSELRFPPSDVEILGPLLAVVASVSHLLFPKKPALSLTRSGAPATPAALTIVLFGRAVGFLRARPGIF